MANVCIVIPAYEPNNNLIELLKEIQTSLDCQIIVVDDGSSKECSHVFLEAKNYARVLKHDINKGKGEALRTAFKEVKEKYIITADADGQHRVKDIIRIYEEITKKPGLIIGSRKLEGKVPLRSLVGNGITRFLFRVSNRQYLWETQSGLRAFSSDLLPMMLDIPGNRYEYEINMLMELSRKRIPIYEMEIDTVYIDDNSSSHFRPIADSVRLYSEILRYSIPSFLSFVFQLLVFVVLLFTIEMKDNYKMIMISSIAVTTKYLSYYVINRFGILRGNIYRVKPIWKYVLLSTLAIIVAGSANFGLYLLISSMIWSKILTDLSLFVLLVLFRYFVVVR